MAKASQVQTARMYFLPSHFFVTFCIISCTATVVVCTVAAGCSGGAVAASADPGSSASWRRTRLAAEPAAADR